jgi:hypothetical protein
MGMRYYRRHHDERGLKAIEDVFRKVWPRLGKIGPDQPDYEAYRIAVINHILDLASQGITDPDQLSLGAMSHFSSQLLKTVRADPL